MPAPILAFPLKGKVDKVVLRRPFPSSRAPHRHPEHLFLSSRACRGISMEMLSLLFLEILRLRGGCAAASLRVTGGAPQRAPCHPERAAEKERRRAERVFALPRAGRMQPIWLNNLYTALAVFRLRFLRSLRSVFGSQGTHPCNAFALLRASARVRLKRRAHFTPCKQGKISRAFEMTQGLIPLPLIRQTAAPFDTFPRRSSRLLSRFAPRGKARMRAPLLLFPKISQCFARCDFREPCFWGKVLSFAFIPYGEMPTHNTCLPLEGEGGPLAVDEVIPSLFSSYIRSLSPHQALRASFPLRGKPCKKSNRAWQNDTFA